MNPLLHVPLALLFLLVVLIGSAPPLHAQHPRAPDPLEPLSHALGGGLDVSGTGGIGILYLRRLDAYPIAVGAGANWPGVMPQVQVRRESTVPSRIPGGIPALHASHLSLGVLLHAGTRIVDIKLPPGAALYVLGGYQLWPTRALGAFIDASLGLGAPITGEASWFLPTVRVQIGWGW